MEFLDSIILREINFGSEELVRSEKVIIAGEELPGGFHICTSCGRVAKPHPEKGFEIKHTMSCRFAKLTTGPEKKAKLPEDNPILLYRELKSEGIRLLLPVSDFDGEARTASIKAAIILGFIKKFGGRPMHLEISEVKIHESANDESCKRFLYLFDSVPGGTGFLRELWSKDSFFEVIEAAKNVLVDCSCQNSPDLDGCPRCILAGASQYDYALISREEAIKYLQEILNHKEGMEIAPGGLDQVDVSSFLDSELEHKFLNIIKNLKSDTYSKLLLNQGIAIDELKISPDVRDGVILKLSKNNKSVSYKMTFQKTLNERERATRVDFYFESIGTESKPIALYLDGYKYHAGKFSQDQMEKDFIKREALVNGDGVAKHGVWILTWNDVDSYINEVGGVHEYLGVGNTQNDFLSTNSLSQFFDYLFANVFPEQMIEIKNLLMMQTLKKQMKYKDPSFYTEKDLVNSLFDSEFNADCILNSHPTSTINYSNWGVATLGYVLASRQKTSYEKLLHELVLDPLNLNDTTIVLNSDQRNRVATGYDIDLNEVNLWDRQILLGNGAIRSSARDLIKYASIYLHPEQAPFKKSIQRAIQVSHETENSATGYAWFIKKDGSIWHNGSTGGFFSFVKIYPARDLIVLFMTNTSRDLNCFVRAVENVPCNPLEK